MLLTLKVEWTDGTTHLLFEPVEVLERLLALTPRPRINLVLHHGVLAPHSGWRARAVAYGRDTLAPPDPEPAGASHLPAQQPRPASPAPAQEPAPALPENPPPRSAARAWSWAQLLRHTFGVDAL